MRFSSRVDVSEPNPIILAQRVAMSKGIKLTKLNDSNPTVHGLAPKCLSAKYTADPRGPIEVRRILADFINARDNRVDQNIASQDIVDQKRIRQKLLIQIIYTYYRLLLKHTHGL